MAIPEPQIVESGARLPSSVAELPVEVEPETEPYLLSFSKYNEKMCQLEDGGFDKKQSKDVLKMIKSIGTKLFSRADISFIGTIKHVVNDGDYTDLYNGLNDGGSPDIKVEEIYLTEDKGDAGRIFFFTVDTEKKFYFLAFRKTHIDTSKGSTWKRSARRR